MVLMNTKRPFAREMTPSKSDCSGQGVERHHCSATSVNSRWAKARRSILASPSVAKSCDEYDDRERAWKKRWISASGLLVIITLSHGAYSDASVRAFRRAGRL